MATFDEIFSGDMPSDVSIDRNVKEAMEYAASHNTFETLAWFYDKVRNGGEWDYKQKDKESAQAENRPNKYEDLGNFNYAVVGKAIGVDDRILKVAAAGAQVAANNTPSVPNYVPDNFKEALKGLLSKGTLGVGSLLDLREGLLTGDFGTYDNNEDQVIIDKGIKAYKDLYGDNTNLNSENYYFKDNNRSNVIFGRNGNDEIQGSGGIDSIKFGSNLNADDIKFNQIYDDLVIKYSPNDQITIKNHFYSNNCKVENFALEDRSILTSDQINKIIQEMYALNTQNNSEFDGFSFSEIQNQSNLQIYG